MVIFHSYVKLPEGTEIVHPTKFATCGGQREGCHGFLGGADDQLTVLNELVRSCREIQRHGIALT